MCIIIMDAYIITDLPSSGQEEGYQQTTETCSDVSIMNIMKSTKLTEEYHFKVVLVACRQEYTKTSSSSSSNKLSN